MKPVANQPDNEGYAQRLQTILQEYAESPVALRIVMQDLFEELVTDRSRAIEELQQENAILRGRLDDRLNLRRDLYAEALEQAQAYAEELTTANEELATANEELAAANDMLNSQNEELVAAQKVADMERKRYYELFDAAPEGYLVTDESGKILEANRTAGLLLAIHKESLIGRGLLTFAQAGSRAGLETMMARAVQGGTRQTFDADLLPIMGEKPICASVSIMSVKGREGAESSLRWMIQDISERKRAEEALLRLNQEVEVARDEANLYVDILTHDIRNTENVSNLYAELLADSLEGEGARHLANLQRNIRKSIEILGTVSTIRQIHRTPSETGPVDLDATIRDAIGGYPHSSICYKGTHHRVLADDLLPVIFNNLIGNAVKHGGPDVEIAVRVVGDGELVRVSIEDTGPGVSDDEKETIFHRYEQQKRGVGEGLGLYLVQILVRRYSGKIWIEDRVPNCPEMGAAFWLTLKKG